MSVPLNGELKLSDVDIVFSNLGYTQTSRCYNISNNVPSSGEISFSKFKGIAPLPPTFSPNTISLTQNTRNGNTFSYTMNVADTFHFNSYPLSNALTLSISSMGSLSNAFITGSNTLNYRLPDNTASNTSIVVSATNKWGKSSNFTLNLTIQRTTLTWNNSSSGSNFFNTTYSPQAAAWGNNTWVLCGTTSNGGGSTALIAYSSDGITWTNGGFGLSLMGNGSRATGVAYGNSRWIAVGRSANSVVISDNNGVTWSTNSSGSGLLSFSFTNPNYPCIAYGPTNNWVAGSDGSKKLFYSTNNGTTWNESTSGTSLFSGGGVTCVLYANSTWFAVGYNGSNTYFYATSTDNGVNWTQRSTLLYNTRSIAFGNGRYVVTGATSASASYFSSIGGTVSNSSNNLFSGGYGQWVTFADGMFIAVGANNYSNNASVALITSTDGITWTTDTNASRLLVAGSGNNSGSGYGRYIANGNGRWIALANSNQYSNFVLYTS